MRRRIILLVVGLTALVVLAFAIPLAVLIRHTVYQRALDQLQEDASHIAYYAGQYSPAPTRSQLAAYLSSMSDESCPSVLLSDGTVVGCTPPDEDALPGDSDDGGGGGGPPGPSVQTWAGGKVVQLPVFSRPDRGLPAGPGAPSTRELVRVYASDSQLRSAETGWWLALIAISLGLLALGVLAAEVLTRRLVRPLTDTAATARRISAGDLTARAPTRGPREISDVGAALNQLADRIDELIAEERETVADLSHRLRTPLTVLRLEADGLRDKAESERIGSQVGELERTLTAVIRAARRPEREGRVPACDATAVVSERVAFWSVLAEDQARTMTVELPSVPLLVRAASEDLATAVDALVENVIAHTPEGTAFAVRLSTEPRGARLVVTDDGPGLPDEAALRGRSDRNSTGLGLDIARGCAQASGGSMTLGATASGGASVILDLGAAARSAELPHSST